MSKHKIGDHVRIDCPRSNAHGYQVVVISELIFGEIEDADGRPMTCDHHIVDGALSDRNCFAWAFEPQELIPIAPYDGNQKVAWSDCPWQPTGVNA